jgi:LmbE family N-acetylglucosaminyl deacetylase
MIKPNSKQILVILAHPDDESYALGGTLSKYTHQGVNITLLCATRGEAGIPGTDPQQTGFIRENELRRAVYLLGINAHFLGFNDGELEKTDPLKLLDSILPWIDLVKPQIIFTFGPDGVSGHSDHVTISKIVTQAYDQHYKKGMLLYIRPSEATALGCGVTSASLDDLKTIHIDISDYKLDKIRAIQSHVSQNIDMLDKPEEAMDKIPCFELFSVAREANPGDNYPDWFEKAIDCQNEVTNVQK